MLFLSPVFADGFDDLLDIDRAWDGQKTITNQDYEEVVNALEENANKKELKKKKKRFRKIIGNGTSLHNELNHEKEIQEIKLPNSKEEGVLINIPVDLLLPNCVLEKGYYKVLAERDSKTKNPRIKFYQSQFLVGSLNVVETEDDFEEKDLDFARVLPYQDNYVKIIFGSIDFNAYAIVEYIK